MTVNQRIGELIKHLGLNANSFSKAIGLSSNSTISRIIKGDTMPSYETLSLICKKYEWVNISWLMFGQGEMNKDSIITQDEHDKEIEQLNKRIEFLTELVETLNMAVREKFEKDK
ncbi:MAG: helix-turn-helix transcriptional regulator [Bacteroidota bacterium]